jgi:exodeoxyribonuclease VII large subunit
MNCLTLKEIANLIKTTIQSELFDDYWVIAEIAKISYHHNSGHCYIDLVEKQGDLVIAQMRATIWARNYRQICSRFRSITGQDITSGMKILMQTRIVYHEVYGLSLNITDIDPSYTLGEMALKRRQIIDQLVREGIIDLNKKIPVPPVMQKVAVISSLSAAGYGDFMSRLDTNPYGYRFSHKLFQAYVQGGLAEQSIRKALRQCKRHKDTFDVVVIIRGGGSTVDLHCFDSYLLAKDIALFPLPVLTGIGHERDETVTDRVAHKRLITPTAVAEYLISRAKLFEERIDMLSHRLMARTNIVLDRGKDSLKNLTARLERQSIQYLTTSSVSLRKSIYLLQTQTLSSLRSPSIDLKTCEERLKGALHVLIKNNYQKLREFVSIAILYPKHMLSMRSKTVEHLEMKVSLLDPVNVLKRGYSITYLRGKAIRDTVSVKKDDIIDTRLYDGSITSIVECIKEKTADEEQ